MLLRTPNFIFCYFYRERPAAETLTGKTGVVENAVWPGTGQVAGEREGQTGGEPALARTLGHRRP
jgi:hypothetical protein